MESVCTPKGYREFESHSLRKKFAAEKMNSVTNVFFKILTKGWWFGESRVFENRQLSYCQSRLDDLHTSVSSFAKVGHKIVCPNKSLFGILSFLYRSCLAFAKPVLGVVVSSCVREKF